MANMKNARGNCDMYDNENFGNGYSTNDNTSSVNTNSVNASDVNMSDVYTPPYYVSAPYMNVNSSYQPSQNVPKTESVEKPKKKEKTKGGAGRFFKKMIACISMGLCFGLCAGVGLYAVAEKTDFLDKLMSNKTNTQESGSIITGQSGINKVDTGVIHTTNVTTVVSDVSAVVEAVMPSMVSIESTYVEKYSYFGQIREQTSTGSGSGIIVGENETELLIATNYHVIEGATSLSVHFVNDEKVSAVVKGTDADMDLAVLAVKLTDLSADTVNAISIAKLGDSGNLRLGEPVVAIGNALGYGQSVTGGWVSALNREVVLENGSTGVFIQTDAAINPGNSGGALLNMNGEVIGINSNKIGGSVIEGMGYAIPISAAQPILEELMLKETREKVVGPTGYLGIVPQSVTAEVALIYGMPEGVFVSQVDEGTPAAKAGLLRGDIIVKFDGTKLLTADELREILTYYSPDETVELTVMRSQGGDYVETTVTVVLGTKPE